MPKGRTSESGQGDSDSIDFTAYAGTTITFIANKHPWIDLIAPRIPEFTELTGIELDVTVYPEEQFRTKRTVEMVSGVSEVDLFMLMPGNSLDAYVREGWVEELSGYLKDPSLGWPGYDIDDIFPTALEAGVRAGINYTLPIMLETSLLAYNRAILSEYGLGVPRTMQELERVAAAIYNGSGGRIYGITMRGKRAASTSQWIDFARSFGGDWLGRDGMAALHAPPNLEATRFYGNLLRRYGPPSAPSNGWYESTALFMQGRAAMVYDASVFRSNYENPQMSDVADKVGYTVIPAGPAGAIPHVSIWGLSISAGSDNKEAAWYFMQWATGRELALEGLLQGIPAARNSAWENPVFLDTEISAEWISASLESYRLASTRWNPPVVDVARGREIVGGPITAAILGEDPESTAREASRALDALMLNERRSGE